MVALAVYYIGGVGSSVGGVGSDSFMVVVNGSVSMVL